MLLGQWLVVGQCLDQADELALQRLPVRAFGFAFQIALPPPLVPDMMLAKRATSARGRRKPNNTPNITVPANGRNILHERTHPGGMEIA